MRRKLSALFFAIALALGAAGAWAEVTPVAPPLDAQGRFEISKPEHIMYLSANYGKKEVPRDGKWVLTADIDMAGVTGYVPMAKDKENGFIGVLDGQGHVIRNLTIDRPGKKYVAFFGYIGNEDDKAVIRNIGFVNVKTTGTQNVGGIVGVSYGTIENCFVIGDLVDDGGSNANTVGGIVGKNKEGESVIGLIKNCYAVTTINGSFNLGGIAGQEDGGGIIENCYAAGTIKARNANGAVGGLVGAFNAGQTVRNCAAMATRIEGAKDTDKIAGQLYDESGNQVTGNIAWDAMAIVGNEPEFQPIKWVDKSASELQRKATFVALGWDFKSVWAWQGPENAGYPILRSFSAKDQERKVDFSFDAAIVTRPVNAAKAKSDVAIDARVISAKAPKAVEIWYGGSPDGRAFASKVAMKQGKGDLWIGKIPAVAKGPLYYFVKVRSVSGAELTKPYDVSRSIAVAVDDGTIFGEPSEIVISLGEKQTSMGINWMTIPAIKDSVVYYAKKDGFDGRFLTATGTSSIVAVTPGFNERMSHKVTLSDLEPGADYVYRVGDGKGFQSWQYEFTAPPDPKKVDGFSFLFMSDPQSVSMKDYETMSFTYDFGLSLVDKPAFTLMTGDITQDGYKASQWSCFFRSAQGKLAAIPFMPAMGNHDYKGDPKYLTFKSRFNTPANGAGGDLGGTNYWFEYGDAFFAVLNTEATPSAAIKPNLDRQLDWLETQLKRTTKKWKIVAFHAGPYSSNHDGTPIKNIVARRLEAMKVDLVLSGHDHLYLRTTMKGDEKVAPGQSTTYVTGGTCGNKYYQWLERSKDFTEVYADKTDCQIVNVVLVNEEKIAFWAMQREDPKKTTFKQIDYFEIPKALSAAPSAKASAAPVSVGAGLLAAAIALP
jgi:hypothetical protein